MILRLHGVLLVYLGLLAVWNRLCSRLGERGARPARRGWEAASLWPLQLLLTAVLVRDRLVGGQPSWAELSWVAAAFPLAFVLALGQNLSAIVARGARLSDIPAVMFNVGVGACVGLSAWTAVSGGPGAGEDVLLHDYGVLTRLLGSFLAHLQPPTWLLPLCVRRSEPESASALLGGLVPPAVGAFGVLVLVVFHGQAQAVISTFAYEAGLQRTPPGLAVGVWDRPDVDRGATPAPPGTLSAWILPADHPGTGLPAPRRPLVLALAPPDLWSARIPDDARVEQVFLDGAERLAAALHPDVLLPFPEPDGEATLLFSRSVAPEHWERLFAEARARVDGASPSTRLAVRLAGAGPRSRDLLQRIAPHVQLAGPRLHPDPDLGADAADAILDVWDGWRDDVAGLPETWILAAGCSPLYYGESGQARFVEGCLARAATRERVTGVVIDAWRDLGQTLGVRRRDGSPRRAAVALARLLGEP